MLSRCLKRIVFDRFGIATNQNSFSLIGMLQQTVPGVIYKQVSLTNIPAPPNMGTR